jgi:flagellar biosynthesis protein FliP
VPVKTLLFSPRCLSAGGAAADDGLHPHRDRALAAAPNGTQSSHNQIVGLSLFLTHLFVMGPTLDKVCAEFPRALLVQEPDQLRAGAFARRRHSICAFMLKQMRQGDFELFAYSQTAGEHHRRDRAVRVTCRRL